jgi:hypothetical protein
VGGRGEPGWRAAVRNGDRAPFSATSDDELLTPHLLSSRPTYRWSVQRQSGASPEMADSITSLSDRRIVRA